MPKDAFDPQDPMELIGVAIPQGNSEEVVDSIIQEYLLMGWTSLQVLFLFRSPYYALPHQLYRQKGEAYIRERLQSLASGWERGWLKGEASYG